MRAGYKQIFLTLSFSFLLLWPWCCSTASITSPSEVVTGSVVWDASLLTYFTVALTGFLAAKGCLDRMRNLRPITRSVFAIALLVVGSVIYCITLQSNWTYADPAIVLCAIWAVLVGVAQPLLYIEIITLYSKKKLTNAIILISVALLIATGVLFLLNYLPWLVRICAPLIVAILCGLFLAIAVRAEESGSEVVIGGENLSGVPWKLFITLLAAGVAFGLFQGSSFNGVFGGGAWSTFGVSGFFVGAIIFFSCIIAFKLDFNNLFYKVAFPFMAFSSVFFLIPEVEYLGYGAFCAGYRYFDALVWCLCIYFILKRDADPFYIVGSCVGSLWCGRFLGFIISSVLISLDIMATVSFVVLAFVLMYIAVTLVDRNNLIEAWGTKQPGLYDKRNEIFNLVCKDYASDTRLSQREAEIMMRLVQGRTREQIAGELFISAETVKTHTQHIYTKCEVHSKEELKRIIDEKAELAYRGQVERS